MATITTEAGVFAALARRFCAPEWACFRGVADATGAGHRRTVDALLMNMYPSRGLTIEGVEIKVSRGDWLRELKKPSKQETVFRYCDRFWLAVGDPAIVRDGELPATWGLLVPGRGGKMKIATRAPELSPEPITKPFMAAILRRASEGHDKLRREVRVEVEAETLPPAERSRGYSTRPRRTCPGARGRGQPAAPDPGPLHRGPRRRTPTLI